jgi:hypothetical protein
MLWKDQLFVAINGRDSAHCGSLYRGTMAENRKGVLGPTEYYNPVDTNKSHQSKLEIRNDQILFFTAGDFPYLFPMTELPCLELNDFGRRLCLLRGYDSRSDLVAKATCGEYQKLLFPAHREPDIAMPPEIVVNNFNNMNTQEQLDELRVIEYCKVARFDLQLIDINTVRLFHARKNRLFISMEPSYLHRSIYDKNDRLLKNPPPVPPIPDRELRTGKLPADFTDYFAAYRSADRDYLVTRGGKVYMAVPKHKTEVEVTAIWTDPKRIIAGVVQDTKTGSVYGYGFVDGDNISNRFYVKFEPKPVAKPYKLTVPLWNDRMDAYLESYECARAFRLAEEKK